MAFHKIFVFLFCLICSVGQSQNLSGFIKNKDGTPITSAEVSLMTKDRIIALSQTDSTGMYILRYNTFTEYNTNLIVKIYDVEIYNESIELIENQKKNIIIDVPATYFLNQAVLIEGKLASIKYNENTSLLFNRDTIPSPAAFGDPSRELIGKAGVTLSNDQGNAISYRRISPEYIKWSIYGSEIVNPNHLANAGTIDDLPIPSAGGVLAIPYDAISSFQFHGHGSKLEVPSSIAGTGDLRFDQEDYSYLQLGLIGVEAGVKTKGKVNFSLVGRYSTVGLLNDLGVSFDNEEIKYQDLFMKINIGDHIHLLNMIGTSNNFRDPIPNSSYFRDALDLDYESFIQVHGVHQKKGNLEQSVFYSKRMDSKETSLNGIPFSDLDINPVYNIETEKISQALKYNLENISTTSHHYSFGINSLYEKNQAQFELFSPSISLSTFTFRPHIDWTYSGPKNKIKINSNVGAALSNYDNKLRLEVQFDIAHFTNQNKFSLQAGRKNQNPSFLTYHRALSYGEYLAPISSFNAAINWKHWINEGHHFQITFFGNQNPNYYELSLTYLNGINYSREDFVYGFDVLHSVKLLGFDLSTTLSLNRKYDNEYLINSTLARNFNLGLNRLNFSLRSIMRFYDDYYYQQAYARIDTRISYQFKQQNFLILDIQNVSNRINTSRQHYDIQTGQYISEAQLGIIPVLSYKRKF